MSETTQPLDSDDVLTARAQESLAKSRESQLLAALLSELATRNLSWWTPETMRVAFPTKARFEWFLNRPDIRQRLTHAMTGLAKRAAREADPGFQADLIDRVLESGDVKLDAYHGAFDIEEMAVHAPNHILWTAIRDAYPWEETSAEDKELMVWLIAELLKERKEGGKTQSIMTPLYIRSAIDVRTWQDSMPLEIRVQVDGRRLRKELEGKSFTCRDELAVVKVDRIVEHIPMAQLKGILDAVERVLPGLAPPESTEEPNQTEAAAKPPGNGLASSTDRSAH